MARDRKTAEHERLEEALAGRKWRRWGTYLSERQWGTVREDYSKDGSAWQYLTHDVARSRAYRWGDDGLLGLCDNRGLVNFAVSLWNGNDPILKERLYGLSGVEGNHGEDVKELYWYLDATPTHSYCKALYKYPHRAFPYEQLLSMARSAGREGPEPELLDTGVFDGDRYFDVQVEYAKGDVEDIFIRLTITNRGPEAHALCVLPTLWFRNTWSWGSAEPGEPSRPELFASAPTSPPSEAAPVLAAETLQSHLGRYVFAAEGATELLFTENDTNAERLFGSPSATPFVKDAFHRAIVSGARHATNPAMRGTKVGARYSLLLDAGETAVLRLRYTNRAKMTPFADFDAVFERRKHEADEFYAAVAPATLSADEKRIFRAAIAGLHWSKQYYAYEVERWLRGDATQPRLPDALPLACAGLP